jgi:thiol-disulfide isomerase/thioredoxin
MMNRAISVLLLLVSTASAARTKKLGKNAVELLYSNITSNLEDWNHDLAIMFHVPWCKYCKQLSPSFDQIAVLNSQSKDLIVGKFDCEVPVKHSEVCKALGVDRYPSVYFIGYGNTNQGPEGKLLGKNINPRVARFAADMYPEAILDWIGMMNSISKVQRGWSDLIGIFSGNSRYEFYYDMIHYNMEV